MCRYHVADSISSISAGIFQTVGQAALPIISVLNGAPYAYIHKHFGLLSLPLDNTLQWIAALLLIDFCYYWFHRKAHEINILWATHVTHHSRQVVVRAAAAAACNPNL